MWVTNSRYFMCRIQIQGNFHTPYTSYRKPSIIEPKKSGKYETYTPSDGHT